MSRTSEIEILRDVNAAASLLKRYDASLPREVEKARALHHRLRTNPPAAPDPHQIGTIALDESPAKAAKALAAARGAVEVHRASASVAAMRAATTLRDHSDEIVTAILTSPPLRAAADEIATVAPTVNPSVPRHPAPGTPEDDVIGAARLRKAEGTIVEAATGLAAIHDLGVYIEPDRVGLLWIDPSEVEDFGALGRALTGIRAGHTGIPVMVTRPGMAGAVHDDSGHGIVSAAAAAVPGVVFRLVETYEEYNERVRAFERGADERRAAAKPAVPARPRPRWTITVV